MLSPFPTLRPGACAALLLSLLLIACGREDTRFSTPAIAFRTYQQALEARDWDLLWSCYSLSYRHAVPDRQAWVQEWEKKEAAQIRTDLRREIAEERQINEKIAYLLFDASTLPSRQESPFFYFLRDAEGWKITTHLDSTFHGELERAIEKGEFKLPLR